MLCEEFDAANPYLTGGIVVRVERRGGAEGMVSGVVSVNEFSLLLSEMSLSGVGSVRFSSVLSCCVVWSGSVIGSAEEIAGFDLKEVTAL